MSDTLKQPWRTLWYILIALGVVAEVAALVNPADGDTLSETVRAKLRPTLFGRLLFMPLLTWLVYHWGFANGEPLGLKDGIAVVAGIVLSIVGKHPTTPTNV